MSKVLLYTPRIGGSPFISCARGLQFSAKVQINARLGLTVQGFGDVELPGINVSKVVFDLRGDVVDHRVMQFPLVAFERQDKVRFANDDLFGDLFLRAHGVDGNDRARDVNQAQQFRNCRDFVGFFGTGDLPQR